MSTYWNFRLGKHTSVDRTENSLSKRQVHSKYVCTNNIVIIECWVQPGKFEFFFFKYLLLMLFIDIRNLQIVLEILNKH